MQSNLKPHILKQFLAASAALLVAGGAFAQAANTPAPQGGMPGHEHRMGHGGGMWMKMIDTDGDGTISKAEADAFFNRLDTNHDGKIDKSELAAFRKTMMEQRRAEMQAEFEARFKAADKNGDGALTRDEVKAGLPRLASHFDELDANHDGKLTMDEIKAGMEKMHQERMQRMPRGGPGAPGAPSSSGG